MILYSNYDLDLESAREFLFETQGEEKGWKSADDVPENDVYEQAYHEDELNWQDFKYELEKFIDGDYWLVMGEVGLWNGKHKSGKVVHSVDELSVAWKDCDYIEFTDKNGHLYLKCSHHDGTNMFEIKHLNQKGLEYTENHWDEYDSVVHSFLFSSNFYTALPHFAKRIYGCREAA